MEDVTIKAIDHKSRGILSELLQVMIQKLKKKRPNLLPFSLAKNSNSQIKF
jgi:hypothetical protein